MKAQIKVLATPTNLSNLDIPQLVEYANDKFDSSIQIAIDLVYECKYCGDALRELRDRFANKEKVKGVGFNQLFDCVNLTQSKLKMSRKQAYRYMEVSERWSEIEPQLDQIKLKIRNGRISPTSLTNPLKLVENEAITPDLEVFKDSKETLEKVETLGTKCTQLESTNKELENTKSELMSQLESKKKEISEQKSENKKLTDDLKTLKNSISDLENKAKEKANELIENAKVKAKTLTKEKANELIEKAESQAKTIKNNAEIEVNKLKDESKELEKKIEESSNEIQKNTKMASQMTENARNELARLAEQRAEKPENISLQRVHQLFGFRYREDYMKVIGDLHHGLIDPEITPNHKEKLRNVISAMTELLDFQNP